MDPNTAFRFTPRHLIADSIEEYWIVFAMATIAALVTVLYPVFRGRLLDSKRARWERLIPSLWFSVFCAWGLQGSAHAWWYTDIILHVGMGLGTGPDRLYAMAGRHLFVLCALLILWFVATLPARFVNANALLAIPHGPAIAGIVGATAMDWYFLILMITPSR